MNKLLALCLLIAVVTACTNDEYANTPDSTSIAASDTTTHVTMHLVGGVTPFTSDDCTTRSANDWQWQDGAVVYLQFFNGTERIRGHAVYTKSTDTWEVPTWAGTIGSKDKCEVYYFDGASTANKTSVTLGNGIGVYADRSASYVYENGTVTVSAALTPQTSRIRFLKATGTSVSSIEVEGITTYTTYDATTNTLTSSSEALSTTVGSTGYTAYIYGNFTDADSRQLGICNNVDGFDTQFRRTFGSSVLQTGHSGYITIPTEDNNKEWIAPKNSRQFTVTGNGKTVTFTMKRVAGGIFQMGSSDSNGKPVHSVTLTKDYYMGETEVTQALWYAVMGQKPTSGGPGWSSICGSDDNYPAYYISYEDCESFISQVNSKLSSQLTGGEQFHFPTEAQWEYAARGGKRSQGYLYAGSNTIRNVAWYAYNSGSKTHEVKGKQANELGLYDMSGNVWEWCMDWYGNYSNSPATDPVNTTSASYRVIRGGCFNDDNGEYFRVAYRGGCKPGGLGCNLGLRLALQ